MPLGPTPASLPALIAVTPDPPPRGAALDDGIAAAAAAGIGMVQLRAPDLEPGAYLELARAAAAACARHACLLLLNPPRGVLDIAPLAGIGDGIHLNGARLAQARQRPDAAWVSAACHDAADLAHAGAIGADLALLSPVLPTASHPGAPTLGWERFAALAAGAALPVYALGGLDPGMLDTARRHGARGVAGIRGFWPGVAGAARD